MNCLVAFVVAVAIAGLSYVTLNKKIADRIRLFSPADPDEVFESKDLTQTTIIVISTIITIAGFVSVLQIQNRISNPLGIAKMVTALFCMVGAACFDFREKRIPNVFPGVMAVLGVLFLLIGFLVSRTGAVAYITSSVFAAAGCAIFLVIAAFLTKQGIGAGDIKLITALALIGGVYTIIGTLFFGMTICCMYALFALLLKKKTIKEALPFGPFLLAGFVVMLFVIHF